MSTTDDEIAYWREWVDHELRVLPSNFPNVGLAASVSIQNAAELCGFTISNTNANAQFFWIFDAISLAGANTSKPDGPVLPVAGSSALVVEYFRPRKFFAGIVIANSTSQTAFTAGAADCWFDVQYR